MDIYVPQITLFCDEKKIFSGLLPQCIIEYISRISFDFDINSSNLREHIYFVSYLEWIVDANGIDLDELFTFIKTNIKKADYINNNDDLNKQNTIIHIYSNGYHFYYPQIYEILMNDWSVNYTKYDSFSINEYIIKSIIE